MAAFPSEQPDERTGSPGEDFADHDKVAQMANKLRWLVGVMMALYSLAVLLISLLLWRWGERHWLLIGLCYAPPVLYLAPLVPLLAAAVALKMRLMVLPLAALTAFIVAGPMDFCVPGPGGAKGGFTVLSYNVRAGLGGDGKGAAPAVAEFLSGSGADLIGLQECRQPIDTRFTDPTPEILERMSGFHSVRGGHRGELLVLSRYPVLSSQEHDLDGYSPLQEIVVDLNGRKVRFLNVHVLTGDPKRVLKGRAASRADYLRVSARSRDDQTLAMSRVLRQSDLPTILVGDFNSPPASRMHRDLATLMQDSWQSAGLGFGLTYRSDYPLWRIDYLWASPQFQVASCEVVSHRLSDHKPLRGSFCWR